MCPAGEDNNQQHLSLFDLLFSNIQPDQIGWFSGDTIPTQRDKEKYSANCMVVLHNNDSEIKSGCYVYEQNQWLLYISQIVEYGAILSTERVEPSQVKCWRYLGDGKEA